MTLSYPSGFSAQMHCCIGPEAASHCLTDRPDHDPAPSPYMTDPETRIMSRPVNPVNVFQI